jgi:RNA polymerase sigma-70 factor, ECF subfamily
MVMTTRTERFRAELLSLIPRLRRFGYALTGSRDAGDDLLQDALEKALIRQAQFEPGTRLDSWMFRIMQTTWIDRMRSEKRKQKWHQPMDDTLQIAGSDGERDFGARLELADVRQAMTHLSEEERVVLVLVSVDGMSYKEASDVLDIPIGTVMSRISRARTNLLKRLAGDTPASLPAAEKGRSI